MIFTCIVILCSLFSYVSFAEGEELEINTTIRPETITNTPAEPKLRSPGARIEHSPSDERTLRSPGSRMDYVPPESGVKTTTVRPRSVTNTPATQHEMRRPENIPLPETHAEIVGSTDIYIEERNKSDILNNPRLDIHKTMGNVRLYEMASKMKRASEMVYELDRLLLENKSNLSNCLSHGSNSSDGQSIITIEDQLRFNSCTLGEKNKDRCVYSWATSCAGASERASGEMLEELYQSLLRLKKMIDQDLAIGACVRSGCL